MVFFMFTVCDNSIRDLNTNAIFTFVNVDLSRYDFCGLHLQPSTQMVRKI